MKSIEEEFLSNVVEDKIKSKRRKSINSKKKGNSGEKECCDILNERFKEVATFHRNIMSGAILGGMNSSKAKMFTEEQRLAFASDISCNQANFKFTIEHKFYKSIDFYDLFNKSSNLYSWYEQSESDAAMVHKYPLLIVKTNNHKRIAFVDLEILNNAIPYVFIHNNKACVWLEDLLTLPNSFFFE